VGSQTGRKKEREHHHQKANMSGQPPRTQEPWHILKKREFFKTYYKEENGDIFRISYNYSN
jgi:hypothetical protein